VNAQQFLTELAYVAAVGRITKVVRDLPSLPVAQAATTVAAMISVQLGITESEFIEAARSIYQDASGQPKTGTYG